MKSRLFTAETLIKDSDEYVINSNMPQWNYCVFIAIKAKNDNCPSVFFLSTFAVDCLKSSIDIFTIRKTTNCYTEQKRLSGGSTLV